MSGTLPTRKMFQFHVEVATPLEFGNTGLGARRCVPLTGGTFTGDLEGEILPGTDWQTAQANNILEISAHYALRTRDGALIEVFSDGVRVATPEITARLVQGDAVTPDQYYFRTHMRFRTAVPALAALNGKLAVSAGSRHKTKVVLDVFEVL